MTGCVHITFLETCLLRGLLLHFLFELLFSFCTRTVTRTVQTRMGDRSRPAGRRSAVGQRKVVDGSAQDLRGREGGTNMRSSSGATGDIRSVPLVVCCSYWGTSWSRTRSLGTLLIVGLTYQWKLISSECLSIRRYQYWVLINKSLSIDSAYQQLVDSR